MIKRLLIILILLISATLILQLYQYLTIGEELSQLKTLQQQNINLTENNKTLAQQRQELEQRLNDQQHNIAVQKVTDKTLQQQIEGLQNEVIELNKELNFYQHIVQGSSSTKLQIRDLFIYTDIRDSLQYQYRIVITQGKKITAPITGTVTIELIGQQQEKPTTIELGQHPLKLRHVQVVEGHIKLEKSLQPQQVKVSLKQAKKKSIKKVFDWRPTISPTQTER